MGEILRIRGVRISIEDTIKNNNREKEHIHFYHNGNRYQAFIDRENGSFYFGDKQNIDRKTMKIVRRILENNYDFIVSQYDNKLNDKPLLRIKIG